MFSVADAPDVTEVGLNVAVTPLGAPETVRLTVCALPFVVAVEIVLLPFVPAVKETAAGLAEILKSLATELVIVSDTVVLCVPLAAVPVNVSV